MLLDNLWMKLLSFSLFKSCRKKGALCNNLFKKKIVRIHKSSIITFCRSRYWPDQFLDALTPVIFRNSEGAIFLLFCTLWLLVLWYIWLIYQEEPWEKRKISVYLKPSRVITSMWPRKKNKAKKSKWNINRWTKMEINIKGTLIR